MGSIRCAWWAVLVVIIGVAGAQAQENGRVVVEWTFDRDLGGWSPNGDLQDVAVRDGVLRAKAVGSDPIFELQPRLNFEARATQSVTIRLRADRDGTGELFWSGTDQGKYGGFDQSKTTRFAVNGDGAWHDYEFLPGWQAEGHIARLRLDVYDGAKFEIDSITVREPAVALEIAAPRFDFKAGAKGWRGVAGMVVGPSAAGLAISSTTGAGLALGPPVKIEAARDSMVSLRMAVDKGRTGSISFATATEPGFQTISFPLQADGRMYTYNVDMLTAKAWRGQVIALGIRPSDLADARATVESLSVGNTPQGPAQVEILSFGPEQALPRVGAPFTIAARITNTGGATAKGIVGRLELPAFLAVQKSEAEVSRVESLDYGDEAVMRWAVSATGPGSGELKLDATAQGGAAGVPMGCHVAVTPRLAVEKAAYVPEPKPVRGPYEVGAYYFPGWNNASRWAPITRFPERTPVLGWYREGDPEVADWHIKWAVEHGITFFAYDWYWDRGHRSLEQGLHDGYFKARYHNLLKFCLLWANHNPPGSSSREDCVAVTRYWIDNYFKRPEHLRIDDRPVMIIFAPDRFREDMGAEGTKAAIAAMREECVKAGLKGLYLVACVGDVGGARRAAEEGYDSVTAYNWPGLGMTGDSNRASFESLVPAYKRHWEHIAAESPIPLAPLPLSGGWDSRPWHGENNLVRFGRSPELFRQHLKDARAILDAQPGKAPSLALVEAWNEWGEGSYIEPQQEYGFGYLDAIRDMFASGSPSHEDITPVDVGLGPYDVAAEPPGRTAWQFDKDLGGWTAMMNLTTAKVDQGALRTRSTGSDPALISPPLDARAASFPKLTLRMSVEPQSGQSLKTTGQLFWQTARVAESESSSVHFEVLADGKMHEYVLNLQSNPRWSGKLRRLRLDPCTESEANIVIESIRLHD